MAEGRRRGNPSGVGPAQPPVAVAVEDVRTPDTPLVACPRPLSAGRTSVHWVGRTSGVQRDRCPRDRCPRDRRDPGVRTDTPPVTVAPASALSAQRWILACVGAAGPPTSGRVGCDMSRWSASGWVVAAPNWGLAGKGWSWVRLCLAPTGSTADRPPVWIRGGCGVALGAGPTWELVQRRVPVGWLGHEQEQLLTRRPAGASWTGCRRDGRLGREMLITLRGRCAGVVRLRRSHSVRQGSRLRPQRGRGTKTHGRSGADSALTSENDGGRDRV
jgi:hypothetical protein